MLKLFLRLLATLLATLPLLTHAAGSALIIAVRGEATVESIGTPPRALAPLTRIGEGDRIVVGDAAELSILFPQAARQEVWSGPGGIQVGKSACEIASGTPQLKSRMLPSHVALQIGRTPLAESDGAARPMKTRAMATPDSLGKLQSQYANLRAAAPPDDREPEMYLLSGLFELREFDRLEQEMTSVSQRYPADPSIRMLKSLYTRAINNARQHARQ